MKTKSKLQEVLDAAELNTRSYSGRGMYGRDCLGVTVDGSTGLGELLRVLVEADMGDGDRANLADDVAGVRSDSMGRGQIYYWPGVEYVDEDSEDDDLTDPDEDDGIGPDEDEQEEGH